MSSWWMVESEDDRAERDRVLSRVAAQPEDDSGRQTVYKRPDGKDVDAIAGHAYAPFLVGPPVLAGSLDKLSKRRTWQKRYWELRGPWLMYWSSDSHASTSVLQRMRQRITGRSSADGGGGQQASAATAAAPHPLGVVDLAKISHTARTEEDLCVVQLVTFSEHIIELRAPMAASAAVGGSGPASPPAEVWRNALHKAISEAREAAAEVNDVEGADASQRRDAELDESGAKGEDDDFQQFQRRLEEFYRQYAKEKIGQVPLLVDRFKVSH